jgi:uroporphyrinogen-III synthase
MGFKPFIAPVLATAPTPDADLDPGEAAALAFTSMAGVAQFAAARPERDLRVYAVGDATAAAALGFGFTRVASASGDVAALARLILDERPGKLLHISGEDQSGDLVGVLVGAGVPAERRIAYHAAPIAALSPATRAAIQIGEIDGVLFHSPRGAQAFTALLPPALHDKTARLIALAMSPAIARAASGLPWRRIDVAEQPNEAAMMALLGATAAKA